MNLQASNTGVSKYGQVARACSLYTILSVVLSGILSRSLFLALSLVLFIVSLATFSQVAFSQTRIKDIVRFEGVRDNMLVGYGLVVGLNGSGDSLNSSVFTRESLVGMLERLGINASDAGLDTDNVAAVAVTATLPPFSRTGSRIDVTVSSLGDSDSLLGGTLLVTPLLGADGEVYAISQGQIAVGGFQVQGQAQTVTRGVPTSGRISNGAIIEREIPYDFSANENITISLINPDFTTAQRIASSINGALGDNSALLKDSSTIDLTVDSRPLVELIAAIEQLPIVVDQPARVVIDESTGVIVMGKNVRISNVAVAQGNLTVRVTETPIVSQPNPFSNQGETEIVPRTQIQIDDGADNRLALVPNSMTLEELVAGLNALGVGPRDLISILQAIKAAGALQADIELL